MNFAERFEDLRIWQEARSQVVSVYSALRGSDAARADFGFRDQIQRAAISVMNNIAEGFERKTPKDFAHFLDVAKGSCGEVRSMLYVAEDLNYFPPKVCEARRADAEKLSRGIAAFTNHIRSQPSYL